MSAGHIHIGYDNFNYVTNNYLIKALDLFISLPLVLMEPSNKRKTMYGKAGAYRTTKYGVEYRSPSNYIFSSTELIEWTFNQVMKAIRFLNTNDGSYSINIWSETIKSIIDKQNKYDAQLMLDKFNIKIHEIKTANEVI